MCWRSFCTFSRPLCVFVRQSFFVSDFVSRFICLRAVNNEFIFITHLSADKLSGLNCFLVSHLRSLSSNFAFPRPKNLNLKKIVMEPIQTLTNICYLDRVLSSYCRCVLFVKLSFSNSYFLVMQPRKNVSFHTSKQSMKSSVFRQDYHDCLNVQSRLHITVCSYKKLAISETKTVCHH